MFYTIQNGSILIADKEESLTRFYQNVSVLPQDYEEGKYIIIDNELTLNPDFNKNKILERESNFLFQFFEIENIGWFRKVPKGYNSAVESINTAFNMVSLMNKLPASVLTFYTKPDFENEEQCTEEWLVSNSFKNEEMTVEEFAQFYSNFMTAWNNQEHLER